MSFILELVIYNKSVGYI